MTSLEIKDIITLNDKNEYVVTSIINYEDKTYVYLVDINNNSNIKLAEVIINGTQTCISEIKISEQKLLKKIIPIFSKQCYNLLNEAEN